MSEFIEQRKRCFQDWMDANGLTVNRVAADADVSKQTLYTWLKEGKKPLGHRIEGRIARRYDYPIDAIFGPPYEQEDAAPGEPNFIGKWRERARMSRSELARELHISEMALESLEEGQASFTAGWARKFEPIFGVRAGFLMHDPDTLNHELLEALGVPKDQTAIVEDFLGAVRARATG